MDPMLHPLSRRLAAPDAAESEDRTAPRTFDELLGHPDDDVGPGDALTAMDREIFAGLVTP